MNKGGSLVIFSLMFLLLVSAAVSACDLKNNKCPKDVTNVSGIISQGGNPVAGASVTVTCAHTIVTQDCVNTKISKNKWKLSCHSVTTTKDHTEDAISVIGGTYSVLFSKDECVVGDKITVVATKGSLTGTNTGSITSTTFLKCSKMNVGLVNVPLVPEFGVAAGAFTILSALGIFFVVRRK